MSFARVTRNAIQRERTLLIVGGVFLLVTAITLSLASDQFWSPLGLLCVWIVSAVLGHRMLNQLLPQRDPLLLPIALTLSGWGLLEIERLAPNFAWRQAAWLVLGLIAMLVVSTLPPHLRWLRRYRYTWLFGGVCLLLISIIAGVNPSGAGPRLWLGAGGLYFQPSELLKLVLVIFLASYLTDYRDDLAPGGKPGPLSSVRALGPLLLMWGLSMVVTIWQQDLGAATMLFIVFLTMLYIASRQIRYVLVGLLLLMLAAAAAYRLFAVVELRMEVWLNPWPEAANRGFQIVQSLIAFASGGIAGQGISQGAPVYIPVVHSDFIFAAIGEEWGLLGTLVVVAWFAVLIMRGLQIAALWIDSHFRMLLVAGLSVQLATQTLLIMGGVLKLIPLTGVTLPFMSYGGSSLLMSFTLLGILLMLSTPPLPLEEDLT
ncbi:MAG: FtsW/RodA/SpoVE family cell cycle protein [Anaerolineae bacterium]|nr:FtsW/RodA/SpoVE family cell cycle protein [Anaerolineae bacterium]